MAFLCKSNFFMAFFVKVSILLILLKWGLIGCQQTENKLISKPKSDTNTLTVIVPLNDTNLFRIRNQVAKGFLVELLNWFAKENSVKINYKGMKNSAEAISSYNGNPNEIIMLPAVYHGFQYSTFTYSTPFLIRNLPFTKDLMLDLMTGLHPIWFQNYRGLYAILYKDATNQDSSIIHVGSAFASNEKGKRWIEKINNFLNAVKLDSRMKILQEEYFVADLPVSKKNNGVTIHSSSGISEFDASFRLQAKKYALDWILLAAITYKESQFDPTAIGPGKAFGLMQFMPFVGRKYNITYKSSPEEQIEAGARIVRNLMMSWKNIPDLKERIKFMLASYNAGRGHVEDAQKLARKYGLNPNVWERNVESMLRKLANPRFYEDEAVLYGSYSGNAGDYTNYVYQIYLSWKAI